MSAKRLLVLAGALFLRCSLAPPAGAQEQELRALEQRVPHLDDARAQLDHARRLKRTLLEREGDDRAFWRALAVEAYRAVRAFHPEAPAVGAEAAFRAAELLRAAGDDEPALRELAEARRLGGGTPFAARALLESGHIHRRAGRSRPALDAYLAVAGDARATQQHRDDAWIWAGQVWQGEGRSDDARRAWKGVAEDGADPLDRILAFDLIASSWLAAGDPEAAAGVLDGCRRALTPIAMEETRLGEKVRKALLRMRTIERLRDWIREESTQDGQKEVRETD